MTDQELNEAVALKFGWSHVHDDHWDNPGKQIHGKVPDYAGSIQAAWDLFGEREYRLERVMVYPADREKREVFWCSIRTGLDEWVNVQADTAPRAICEAFLKLDAEVAQR